MDFLNELTWRGLIFDSTLGEGETLPERAVGYIGFDPTADSLHVGSLIQILALARLQQAGGTPIALIGGGTGLIGDPSGKSNERPLLEREQIEANLAGIRAQLEPFLDFERTGNAALMVDNADWLATIPLTDFLRDIGKHFTVNLMLSRESVKRRIDSDDGISYTEFSYMLLQAYDFAVLYQRYGCNLQVGGSDQWGNIVSGIDLVRRLHGEKVYGVVQPLIATASGTKFGKSEAGTVWLDPKRTSPYRFFQFWLNTDDRDVPRYLRYFTELEREEIEVLETAHEAAPHRREAHRRLAEEVTRRVHGASSLARAQEITELFFGGRLAELTADEVLDAVGDAPSSELARVRLAEGLRLQDLLAESGVVKSKGEARRAVAGGGIYLNDARQEDPAKILTAEDALEGRIFLLRKGKKNYHLVRLTD
ncbi:MAG: tyrosine--tRNA ligase [Acidobacteriota bacterium]